MRRILCILLLLLCGLTPAQKKVLLQGSQDYEQLIRQHQPTLWLDGTRSEIEPLVHYTCEDNAASTAVVDASANHAGTAARNTSTFSTASGKITRGFNFFTGGTSDSVTIASAAIGSGNASISFWMAPDTYDGGTGASSRPYNDAANGGHLGATGQFVITRDGYATFATYNSIWSAGVWVHVAVIHDGATTRLYKNGVLQTPASGSVSVGGVPGNVIIGNRAASDRPFDGLMDDIRIYDRALTPGEISLIYNNGVGHQSQSVGKSTGNVVVDASTATVSDWGDKSGNGRFFSQATAANQPLFVSQAINGRSAVRFDGAASYMTSTATLGGIYAAQAKTSFLVLQHNATGATQFVFTDSAGSRSVFYINTTNGLIFYNYDGLADTCGPLALTSGATQIATGFHDTTNIGCLRNGVAAALVASGATQDLTNTLFLGQNSQGARWYNGDLAELITFNKVLPSDVRIRIQKGLCKKWGASC